MRAATRGAGRGTSLTTNPKPTSVTRISQRRQNPQLKPPAGRGTFRTGESGPVRSSLTSSVLRRRDPSRNDRSRSQRNQNFGDTSVYENAHYAEDTTKGRFAANSKRKISDWYTSNARKEALAGLAQASLELEEALKRPADPEKPTQPFAWADLSEVASQLPDGHWAHNYVSGVVSSIERNCGMDANQKERILGEVLQALGHLSRENEERFQDAEG